MRVAYCDGYSNMMVTNFELQSSDGTLEERAIPPVSHTPLDSSKGQRADLSRPPVAQKSCADSQPAFLSGVPQQDDLCWQKTTCRGEDGASASV